MSTSPVTVTLAVMSLPSESVAVYPGSTHAELSGTSIVLGPARARTGLCGDSRVIPPPAPQRGDPSSTVTWMPL